MALSEPMAFSLLANPCGSCRAFPRGRGRAPLRLACSLSSRTDLLDRHLGALSPGAHDLLAGCYIRCMWSRRCAAHRSARQPLLEIADLEGEPLLLLQRGFGSREWFDIACEIAHIRPHVLLESAAPQTLVALAATDYAIAILPSNAQLPHDTVRSVPLVHHGASIGRWAHIAWDPQRFLAPYAQQFVTELVA